MQEIPSDVLLLTIDYLDSPTMINCRQVSKKWLDVVDGNRSLYSFFYLPEDSKPFKQEMFDLFAEKSVSGFRAVSIVQKVHYPQGLINSLSNSSPSLRYILFDNPSDLFLNPNGLLSSMPSLSSFSYYSTVIDRYPRFRLRDVEKSLPLLSNSKATCSLTSLHLLGGVYWSYSSQELEWCSASLKHLAIMVSGKGPFEILQFPNLQALELHCVRDPGRVSSESCPNLKAIYFYLSYQGSMAIKGLPVSLEKVWLSWTFNAPTSRSIDLWGLNSSLPHLQELRLEDRFGDPDLVLELMRARRSAVEQGAEVEGIKMKPIEKLTIEKQQFSNQTWSELEGLVEELVNLKDAPKVEEIPV